MGLRTRRSRGRLFDVFHRASILFTGLLLAFLLVVLVLLVAAPRSPETPGSVASVSELERFLEELVASGNPPSVSLAVVRDEEVVYRRAFGRADGPRRIEATPDTVYRWWSVTKLLTAVAVLQLHESGKLGLDDPVEKYVPFFDVTFRGERKTVTIRNLLNHSSGLPDLGLDLLRWTHRPGEAATPSGARLRDAFPRFARLRFEPGAIGVYSNFGYLVLGEVIERAAGRPYESYVRESVLLPLGMEQTSFVVTEEVERRLAAGSHPLADFQTLFLPLLRGPRAYVRDVEEGRIWLEPFELDASAYGGAMGTATDAARLLRAFLGEMPGLESESLTKRLEEDRVPAGASAVAPSGSMRGSMRHSLGFWVFQDETEFRYEHTGAGPGFASIVRLYPARSLGIVVLANGTALDREGIADLAALVF